MKAPKVELEYLPVPEDQHGGGTMFSGRWKMNDVEYGISVHTTAIQVEHSGDYMTALRAFQKVFDDYVEWLNAERGEA